MLTLATLRNRVRIRINDTVPDYLWSDPELNTAINDVVRDAAIRAGLTVQTDFTIAFQPTLAGATTYKAKYQLPSGVLDVRSVYLASTPSKTLVRTSLRQMEQFSSSRPTSSEKGTPWGYALDQTQSGTGESYGLQARTITFIGTPNKADTANLSIIRLPALLEAEEDIPEIDEIWHPDLVYGVVAQAYLKTDPETYSPKDAAINEQRFEDRFGPRISAAVMRERQTDVPLEMIVG